LIVEGSFGGFEKGTWGGGLGTGKNPQAIPDCDWKAKGGGLKDRVCSGSYRTHEGGGTGGAVLGGLGKKNGHQNTPPKRK